VPISSLLTVVRASGGYNAKLDGSLQWFGNNALRMTDAGLLVEGSRTNLLLRSQEFGDAAWSAVGITVTSDTTVAPDGTLTADTITTAHSSNNLRQAVNVTPGASYVFSFFALKGSLLDVKYSVYNLTGSSNIIGPTSYNASINASTWTRIIVPFTAPAGCTQVNVYPVRDTGVGAGTVIIWGAQLEAAAFASSYIPTGASTAARASDRVTLDPSFIGGEGTFVAETFGSAGNDANNGRIIGLGGPGQVAAINRTNAANTVQAWNGAQVVSATMGAGSWAGVVRAAIAFSPAGRAICGNAGGVATDAYALGDKTSLAVGSQSTGAFSFYGYIRRLTYFDRRISNAGLQALTA